MRDRASLKPRKVGTKDPEDLLRILSKIYPEDLAYKLFMNLTEKDKGTKTDGRFK